MSSLAARAPATGFSACRERFRGIDAIRLSDNTGMAHAVIALKGATLLDWQVATAEGTLELTDGYRSASELELQNGVRNGVLAPFQNRIAGARYRFDGRDHDLMPDAPAGDRLIYHGFARTLDFKPARVDEAADAASVVLACEDIHPGTFAGYPFSLSMRVRVGLSASTLSLDITVTNTGDDDAPVSLGWHPYFCLGTETIDTLELEIPASALVVTDGALIPLPGNDACAPLGTRPERDFSTLRPVGDAVLDCCYAGLRTSRDGRIKSTLRDPASGNSLRIWQHGGLVHAFTGDTLARGQRRSIAIESVSAPTDAFNRSDCEELVRLAAGARRSFSFGAEFLTAAPIDHIR